MASRYAGYQCISQHRTIGETQGLLGAFIRVSRSSKQMRVNHYPILASGPVSGQLETP